ncbi:hypothetical protein Fmac_020515 [Flemingia macrophylla]|uniref:non-specific serine/threonine protein kinase n=1 Tax=Flemingia macrophylla TaxID=520843 RepID=A0ABD1LU72_9FABA
MDHACTNSANNLVSHVKEVNRAANNAPTDDYTTNGARQIGQTSENNSNMTREPTSKPQKLENPIRNISDFSTTQRPSPSASARMPSNSNPSTTSSSETAETTKEFHIPTKQTNQGQGRGSNSPSDSLEGIGSGSIKHGGMQLTWFLERVGYGDIGSVYLVELKGSKAFFAMKVMDKASLANRNKLLRAQTEREILGLLDHPFLPTLYSYFETDKYCCLVMEFCSSGSLHSLRLKQSNKYFTEEAARDLKPENVLVRDEGHIMLSDFDLSLRCTVNPTLVKSSSAHDQNSGKGSFGAILHDDQVVHGCMQSSGFFPRILHSKKNHKSKSDFGLTTGGSLPELMAEPTNVRSMSFVGTHEYLAPEIIRGEGHGSAVDWWTFGIFLYELLHGITPFKGTGNKATLYNVVGQPLRFPGNPRVSNVARDLIKGLLVKEPQKRFAYKRRGATEIKQHPFFDGVNWALIRSSAPPVIPKPFNFSQYVPPIDKKIADSVASDKSRHTQPDSSYGDFECQVVEKTKSQGSTLYRSLNLTKLDNLDNCSSIPRFV